MGKCEKLIAKILSGRSDANITFPELRKLILIFGFFGDNKRKSLHIQQGRCGRNP
ncbi:hypothetical protein C8N25_1042 [Algoriphagus antarcticus]|uniref:Uncharacterized protein n=1 Tax=Algoriphagus antarcticus TaxID=238540 RepID=A0A3E0DZF2_9BACT|nr:hypothetical protein C8N25_1042 [Algoriphagus antarcticus]